MVINKQLIDIIKSCQRPRIVTSQDSFLARVCSSIGGHLIYDERPTMKYKQHTRNTTGFKAGRFNKIKIGWKRLRRRKAITIDMQAKEINRLYSEFIPKENMKCINKVCHYKDSIFNRILLALSTKTRYDSLPVSIAMRMAILIGNR